MKYDVMIRSRPSEDILQKHERFLSFLSGLGNEWGLKDGAEIPKVKDPGTLPMRQVNLSKCFQKGIKALVSYQNRKYHRDEGKFDDYFKLEFDPTKFRYELLVKSVFEEYIASFQAYTGHVGDEEFIQLDFENWRQAQVDSRSGVYRIHPICFFDRELCGRGFHLTPEEIANRVEGAVENASVVSNGVLIIANSKILTIEESNTINDRLKKLLAN
jgi:hypothetical protein